MALAVAYSAVWIAFTLAMVALANLMKSKKDCHWERKHADVVDVAFIVFLTGLWPLTLPIALVTGVAIGLDRLLSKAQRRQRDD